MKSFLAIAVLFTATLSHAADRSCAPAAKSAVERFDRFNPVAVSSTVLVTKKNSKTVISLVASHRAIDLGVSPNGKTQILSDLKEGSEDYKYFIAKVGKTLFLIATDALSCAPGRPMRLN